MDNREISGCIIAIAFTFFVFGMCWQIIIDPSPWEIEELKSCALMADAGFDIQLTERGCDVNTLFGMQQVNYVCAKHIGQPSRYCFYEE